MNVNMPYRAAINISPVPVLAGARPISVSY
jgi:hypothetical protein